MRKEAEKPTNSKSNINGEIETKECTACLKALLLQPLLNSTAASSIKQHK